MVNLRLLEHLFQNLPEEVEGMDLETEEIPVGPPIDQSINQKSTPFLDPQKVALYIS